MVKRNSEDIVTERNGAEPENRSAEVSKKNGRFAKGVSGNPGGRPKLPAEFKAALKELTPDALRALGAGSPGCSGYTPALSKL